MGERPAFLALLFAVLVRVLDAARALTRVRLQVGPLAPVIPPAPPPIADAELLDKRGRPLRGAARASRIAAIERRRALLVPVPAPAPAGTVIVLPRIALPSLPALRVPTLSTRAIRLAAVTMTATFVFATVIGTTGLVSQRGTIALGASTTLSIIAGQVSARSSDTDEFQPIADGATLRAGMTIRTGPDSYAVLTYFEGSTVSLDPGTTLVIKALQADPDGSTVISMEQQIGRTWHSVTKLVHPASKYEVTTPTATATVRGTMFAVGVDLDPQGEVVSTVQTTEGAVATSKAPTPQEPQPREEVLVRPGFEVSVTKAAPLEQPKPAPEPERKVTVTVGAAAGIVLDPFGRANGVKDGKIVVQTPGAVVERVDGKLVITLPDLPDGKLSTVVERRDASQREVDVVTSVTEKGQPARTSSERLDSSQAAGAAVVAVELKKGVAVEVAPVTPQQRDQIASSVKVAEVPKAGDKAGAASVGDVQGASSDDAGASTRRTTDHGPGVPPPGGGFVPLVELPQLPALSRDTTAPQLGKPDDNAARKGSDLARQPSGEQQPAPAAGPRNDQRGPAPRPAPPANDQQPAAPKADAPKVEAPKPEAPKPDAPKPEAPKPDAPKPEAPKPEAPKPDARKPDAPTSDRSKFLPEISLPRLPFFGSDGGSRDSAPAKDQPARNDASKDQAPKNDAPRFDPPKFDLRIPDARGGNDKRGSGNKGR